MCWCTPEIRTPNCGAIGCHPPRDEKLLDRIALLEKQLAAALSVLKVYGSTESVSTMAKLALEEIEKIGKE